MQNTTATDQSMQQYIVILCTKFTSSVQMVFYTVSGVMVLVKTRIYVVIGRSVSIFFSTKQHVFKQFNFKKKMLALKITC